MKVATEIVCPRHGRVHQPREHAVLCRWCGEQTWQAEGLHMSCQLDMSRDGFHDHDHGWRMCLSVRPADDLPWRGAL